MNARKLLAHARRFAGLPMLPQPEGVECPTWDGDMAYLDELADKVIATYGDLPELARFRNVDNFMPFIIDLASIRHALTVKLQPPLFDSDWPDPIADLLAEWPKPIVCPVVCP